MRNLTYILGRISLACYILLGLNVNAQVVVPESSPLLLTNIASICDIGPFGEFDVEFESSEYNNALHIAFGIEDHVNTLFTSDQIDPVISDLNSLSESLVISFNYQVLNASGAVVYPEGGGMESVELTVEPEVGSMLDHLKYVDLISIEHIPTGNYTIALSNVSITSPTLCSSFPENAILRVFKTSETYSTSPNFISGPDLVISFSNLSTKENVEFTLPPIELNEGHGIDLEWINIERPLAGLTAIDNLNGIPTSSYNALSSISIEENHFKYATRVNLKNEDEYTIPNLFKRGYLLARCRAVDYTPEGIRIEGDWSVANVLKIESTFEDAAVWQSTSSYIENGKHKDVVSYYDGSQRNRQIVTKLESIDKAIVGETFYDYQGRPSINPLPVPDLSNNSLNLRSEFNRFVSGPITPDNFDTKSKDLSTNTLSEMEKLSSTNGNGAGVYYSSSNTIETNIPYAEGYAYTKTLYTNDGTDRPIEVSSLGDSLTIQNGRTSRFYYASPFQEELDRLFGNNAGDASKYKKNYTRDANYQMSVTYLNQAGQVVASALSQNSPRNLDSVNLSSDNVVLKVDLLSGDESDKEVQEIDELGLTYTQSFTSTIPGVHVFSYQIKDADGVDLPSTANDGLKYCSEIGTPPVGFGVENAFQTQTGYLKLNDFDTYPVDQVILDKAKVSPSQNQTEIIDGCTDCLYNLFIGVIDPDGYAIKCYVGENSTTEEVNFESKSTDVINSKLENFNAELREIGTYTIIKVLSINEDTLEFKNRINRALLNFKPEVAFEAPMQYDETCYGYYKYITRLQDVDGDGIKNKRFSEEGEELEPMNNAELNAYIEAACENSNIEFNDEIDNGKCLESIDEFLADVSPGGQYFDNTPDQYIYVEDVLKINPDYQKNGWLENGTMGEREAPSLKYAIHENAGIGETGLLPYIQFVIQTDMSTSDPWYFEFNTWDDLRNNWRPEFAHIFLPFHPEFLAMIYNCRGSYLPQMEEVISVMTEHEIHFQGFNHESPLSYKPSHIGNLGLRLDIEDDKNIYMPDHLPNARYKHKFSNVLEPVDAIPLGYFNPLGLLVEDYPQPSLLPAIPYDPNNPDETYEIDPYFKSLTGNKEWIKEKVGSFLMNFTPKFDGTTDMMSIYELLEYNLDIGEVDAYFGSTTLTSLAQLKDAIDDCDGGGCSQNLIEALNMAIYHYPEIGLISMTNKFQFFKSIYLNYRNFAQYTVFKELGSTPNSHFVFANQYNNYNPLDDQLSSAYPHFYAHPHFSYPLYYMPKISHDIYARYNNAQSCNYLPGLYPVIEIERTSSGGGNNGYCFPGIANRIIQNIDGTLSYFTYNESYDPFNNGYVDNSYGRFYEDEIKEKQIKRNDGFTFRYPVVDYFEAMEDAEDNQELLELLEEMMETAAVDLDVEYAKICKSRRTDLAYLLLVDDERNSTSVIPSDMPFSILENKMYDYCINKRALYYSKAEADAALSTALVDFTYSTHTENPNDIFNLEGSSTDEAIGYNNAVKRIKDIECACKSYNTDVVMPGIGNNTKLSEFYFANDLLNLPPSASTMVINKLDNWKSTCDVNKGVYKPKDLYDVVLDDYTGLSYNALSTFTGSYLDFVDNYGGSGNIHDITSLYECSVYDETDPQIILIKEVNEEIRTNNLLEYFQTQDQKHLTYKDNYLTKCLDINEKLTLNINLKEYQYTLYYYDASGNLIATVPPKGVDTLRQINGELNAVKAFREGTVTEPTYPSHSLMTHYKYNVLNNLIEKETPDGGKTKYKYDQLGRVICSQNAQQRIDNDFSYTIYDQLGRIVETGEAQPSTVTLFENVPSNTTYSGGTNPFKTWVHDQDRQDVSETIYDKEIQNYYQQHLGVQGQQNLRGRVSYTRYSNYLSFVSSVPSPGTVPLKRFKSHTIYSYDVHGNVKKMLQVFSHHAFGDDFKLTEYEYDLVSGNVLEVHFQPGQSDQFHHKYTYDEDNRLKKAFTSNNGHLWKEDAKYYYYAHGPLKRSEIGSSSVQGLDYAYTLQGWLKGVNGSKVGIKDIGGDGQTNGNSAFGQDVMAFSLDYFNGDYITESANPGGFTNQILSADRRNLFNGNISRMYTGINFPDQSTDPRHVYYNYHYDQLQRITQMQGFKTDAFDEYTISQSFAESRYAYDKMGNLTELDRSQDGVTYDALRYEYNDPAVPTDTDDNNNYLHRVNETNASTSINNEFDQTNSLAYDYDAIGNLIEDPGNKIDQIIWTPGGKVHKIIYNSSCAGCADLEFVYNAMGNRILKIIKEGTSSADWIYKYYALDARGNQMAHYEWAYNSGNELLEVKLKSHVLYGSDRLGVQENNNKTIRTKSTTWNPSSTGWAQNVVVDDVILDGGVFRLSSALVDRLGTTGVSDIKMMSKEYIHLNFTKVVPAKMKLRSLTPLKINQREVRNLTAFTQSAQLVNGYYQVPAQTTFEFSPQGANVNITGLPDLGTGFVLLDAFQNDQLDFDDLDVSYYPELDIEYIDYIALDGINDVSNSLTVGLKRYELKNHLGNVLSVVSDFKTSDTEARLVTATDYLPFGMQMPGRKYTSPDGYRYGFNGMENDDEVNKGPGNSIDFGARMYDPRLGRWFTPDAHASSYPEQSPYHFAYNNPNLFVDPDGNDNVIYLMLSKKVDAKLTVSDLNEIAKNANKILADLGLSTKVVVFNDSEPFSSKYLDDNDGFSVIGEVYSVNEAIKANLTDAEWQGENWKKVGLSSRLPWGSSSNPELSGLNVNVVGIHASGSKVEAGNLGLGVNMFRAYLLVHGLIHTTGVNGHVNETEGTLSKEDVEIEDAGLNVNGGFVNKVLTGKGSSQGYDITNTRGLKTMEDISDPNKNAAAVDKLESHYDPNCTGTSTDNYQKNKKNSKNP